MVMVESGVELARAPAPGARPRGRWRSVLLVGVALLLSATMGVVNPAPANAWIGAIVPVAKGVAGIVATTVAGEVVFTKNDDGGDSPESKKARGKWGDKLKGLPGLAAGLLGGMVGWLGVGEMVDGVKAPEDFQAEAAKTNLGDATSGRYRTWTITDVVWDRPYGAGGVYTGPRIMGDCGGGSASGNYCPADGLFATSSSTVAARYECWNGTEFVLRAPGVDFNQSGPFANATTPCNMGSSGHLPARSVFIYGQGSGISYTDGLANPQKFINPHFDESQLPEDAQTLVKATGECRDPDSGNLVTVEKTVVGLAVIPTVQCPQGMVPESIGWTTNKGGVTEDLGGVGTDWTPFPECAGFKCEKLITVDDVPCRVGIQECYDWQNVDPGRVKCEYGPYSIGLAECSDLTHTYKTTHGVTQDPRRELERTPGWLPSNPDGTVDWTRVGTDYRPDDDPNPEYRPPVRWDPEGDGDTPTQPTPTPTAPPGPPTSGPNPPVPGNPTDLDTGQNCIADAWSYNPVDWVFIPVKCALQWAFVPKPAAAASLNTTATGIINGVGLGDWLGVPQQLWETIPVGGGCRGPELALPESMGGGIFYPLDACQDPLAKAAEMTRAISSLVIGVAGAYSILNSLSLALTGYRLIEPTTKDVDR